MIARFALALVHLLRIASKTGNTLSGMFMVITSHVWKSGVNSPNAEIKKNDAAATVLTAAAKVGIYPFVFPRLSTHLFAVWRDVKEFGWFGQSKSAICCMCYDCILFQQNGSSEYKLRLLDYCWWTTALFFSVQAWKEGNYAVAEYASHMIMSKEFFSIWLSPSYPHRSDDDQRLTVLPPHDVSMSEINLSKCNNWIVPYLSRKSCWSIKSFRSGSRSFRTRETPAPRTHQLQ